MSTVRVDRALILTIAGFAGVSALRAHAAEPEADKIARPALTETAPVIDGRLDEPAWQTAPVYDDFVERSPTLRGQPTERTAFRLLVDGAKLYVGIVCYDREPESIRARTMQRDSTALFDDDAISVKIDPQRDRRTSFGFGMNAAGGRIDYRGVNDNTFQFEVDLVWEGATTITAEGWTAEFAIPWSALGIDPSHPPVRTGFEVSRDQSRLNATYDWALIAPPYSPIAASQYGELADLPALLAGAKPVDGRTTWAIMPWALAGFSDPADGDLELKGDAGLDLEAELGGGFSATVTVNTDFAQVEVDDVTTNLDRFDLFLPEKRDFFLKDGDLFQFGDPDWATLFHSRTIGLTSPDSASELPIVGGVKLSGRTSGGFRLGALTVLTRPRSDFPWRLDSVLRVQQAFDNGTAVGLMSTLRKSLEDEGQYNVTAGMDGHFTEKGSPLLVRGHLSTSFDDDGSGDDEVDVAGHLKINWRGEVVRPFIGYAYIGREFRADLGFFQRRDIQNGYGGVEVESQIGEGGIRLIGFFVDGDFVLDAGGSQLLDWGNGYGTWLVTDSGFWVGVFGGPGEVTVDEFTIGDHAVAAGTHDRSSISLEGGTPTTEAVSLEVELAHRGFFGGKAWVVEGRLVARPGTWLRAQLEAESAFISLPSGDFSAPTVNLRLSSSLSTDLELSTFAGWSDLENLVSIQSRLRWTFGQGDDLFAVWEMRIDDESGEIQNHSFIAKVALRFP